VRYQIKKRAAKPAFKTVRVVLPDFFYFAEHNLEKLFPLSGFILIFTGLFTITIGVLMSMGKNPHLKFCKELQGFFLKKDAKTIIVFGLVTAILPCLPLLSVLSYIGIFAKSWINSIFFSFCFGLGTAVSPLFILILAAGLIPRILTDKHSLYRIFNFACGTIIIFLGIRIIMKSF